MRFGVTSLLACAVLIGVATSPAYAQSLREPGRWNGKWWSTDRFKQELKLSDEQSSQIEQIFQASLPKLRASKQDLDREEAGLSRLMAKPVVDEEEVSRSVDRVEAARCDLSRTRTMMLFRMHRVLSPEQRAKLELMHRRDDADRRRGPAR